MATRNGTPEPDTLTGTNNADIIRGFGKEDLL